MHAGFPIEEKRCFICKSPAHSSRECTRPGGGADPNKDKHWGEYRARREEAVKAGKAGKGAKGKGKGAKDGKGKNKGGRRAEERGPRIRPARLHLLAGTW